MTTSVDILFKELPAPYAADDRFNKNDAKSSATRDAVKDSSYKSERYDDIKNERSFSDHLDDQTVVKEKPEQATRPSLPDHEPKESEHVNAEVDQKIATTNVTDDQTATIPESDTSQVEAVAVSDPRQNPEQAQTKTELNSASQAVNAADIQSETPKTAVKQENVPSSESPLGKTDNNAQTSAAQNLVNTPASQPLDASQANQNVDGNAKEAATNAASNGLINTKTDNTEAKITEVNTKNVQSPSSDVASLQPSQKHPEQKNDPAIEGKVPAATSNEGTVATQAAISNALTQTGEGISSEAQKQPSVETPINAAVNSGNKVDENQSSKIAGDVVTPDLVTTNIQEQTPKLPQPEKAAAPLAIIPENTPIAPAAPVQNQNAVTNQAVDNKKASSKGKSAAGVNVENQYTASANNASQAGQASSQQGSQQSAVKADISYDFSANIQKNEPAPLQSINLNGQTNLTTGGLLSTQEVTVQKIFANLTTPAKADNPMLTKMMNEQITVAINKSIVNGQNNFSVRLHPAELGQVDIRLEFLTDGKIQAAVSVENEKTLAMLQRDQSALEKALQEGGINLSNKDLNFSLMKQGQDQQGQKFADANKTNNDETDFEELSINNTLQEVRMSYSNQAIDISI